MRPCLTPKGGPCKHARTRAPERQLFHGLRRRRPRLVAARLPFWCASVPPPMDPGFGMSPTEPYELLGVVGGVLGTGALGFWVVGRARAARRRQIDEAGEARPTLPRRRSSVSEPEDVPDEEPSEAPALDALVSPERASMSAASPAVAPRPPGPARVLPFPSAPSSPKAVPVLPTEK